MSSPKVNIPTAKLNTGASIPLVGFGTFAVDSSEPVKCAIQTGYRHIDGAALYDNEEIVGKGIKDAGVDRSELFIVTKVWNDMKGDVQGSLDKSLKELGTDYVDLFLMHCPNTFSKEGMWEGPSGNLPGAPLPKGSKPDFHDAWEQMSKIYKEGKKVKAIGVSNFSEKTLEELFAKAGKDVVVPAVNQIEMHPDIPQTKLLAYCKTKGIHCTAWSPLGGGGSNLTSDPYIKKIAESHGEDVSTGQVLISWGVARGNSVIPKSSTPARILQNAQLVALSPDQTKLLDDKHKEPNNPKRIGKGEAKTKEIMKWTYEEMGWEDLEDL